MRDARGCKLEQCFTAGAHRGARAGGAMPSKTVVFVLRAKKVEGATAMNQHRRRLFGTRLRRLFTSTE